MDKPVCILCAAKTLGSEPVSLALAVMLRTHEDGRAGLVAEMCSRHQKLAKDSIAEGIKQGVVTS
ncbi:MAG TPA: hypothetical protein VFA98_01780 [Thermoanaerobaculia bacterium]|jgi:hypothetical protein|nr:hypothetical protein [Thermoanaerobaculia bacterium]